MDGIIGRGKIAIALCLVLFITGCSAMIVGYRFLDNFLRWKINEYVTLDFAQGRALNGSLKSFHNWHRKDQLPAYIAFLKQHEKTFQSKDISPEQMMAITNQGMDFLNVSVARLLPGLEDAILTFSPSQVDELIKNLDKEDAEYEDEHFDIPRRMRHLDRRKEMAKRLSPWIGRLNTVQIEKIKAWAETLAFNVPMRREQRKRYRTQLIAVLKSRKDEAKFRRDLKKLVLTPESYWTAEYQTYYRNSKKLTMTLLADIMSNLSDTQRLRLMRELQHHQRDFSRMIR